MSNLSEDLHKLQRQATAAEQQANHKNAEVQAAQKKLDSLQSDIEQQTARLLANQQARLTVDREDLEEAIRVDQARVAALKDSLLGLESYKSELIKQITNKKEISATVQASIEAAHLEIASLEITQQSLQADVATQQASKQQLELDISILSDKLTALTDSVVSLEAKEATHTQRMAELEEEYTAKLAEKEKSLALLDAKLLDRANQLQQNSDQFTIEKDRLATWQKQLDVRDKNLRVREINVETGESKLIQNSNLLNL